MQILRSLLLVVTVMFASGCGLIDYYFLPPPEDTAQELYETALDAMGNKHYDVAAENFQKLKDNFPFSQYTIESELALADAYYLDENYAAAAEAYKDFEMLHPRHEAMAYVLFQTGSSLLKSFVSIDRPTTNVQESIEYFNRLRESFPDSEYAAGVDQAILEARHILAEHELYIGDVFWQSDRYGPAWRRYSYILDMYPDITDVYKHAEEKALAAYYKFREQQGQLKREELEGSWKDWFKWL